MNTTQRIIKRAAAFLCLCFALLLALNGPFAALAETPAGYPAVRIDPATGRPYDLGGETVYIYDYWSGSVGSDARSDDPTDEQIALYAYRDWLDQTYNCHIVQVQKGDWGTHEQELENFVKNSDGTLCVYILTPESVREAVRNDVIDTWDSGAIDLTDSKWNKGSTSLTEKDGQTSTLSPGASEPRQVIFFNKTLLTQAGVNPDTIYAMQKNNTWTWSAFENILSQVHSGNVAAITGSSDDFYRIAVFANGGSFFDYNSDGDMAITADSANTVEALNWAKRVWNTYAYQQQEDDSWDYYKQAFSQGKAVFYMYQAYGSSEIADMDWGCVAFPIGPSSAAQKYVTLSSDNVAVMPKVYDDSIKAKLSLIYDLWTNPTPGYEQQPTVSASFLAHGDEDANETYAMLQGDGNSVVDKTMLLGSQNDVTGSGFLWRINDPECDAETLIESNRASWQALCDRANGIAPQRLEAPVIYDVIHGETVGGEFSARISVPEGATVVCAEFGRVDENGDIFGWPWDMIYSNTSNRFNVLGFDMLEPGTYRLEARARINDSWEESEQDSEVTVYEFTLADAEIPDISDKVTLSATENIQFNDRITFTVAGAEAVTCQLFDEDGEWGSNPPTNYTAGSSDSITFWEPGNTHITIWARYNGVWSAPYDTTVYVQPLGELEMPYLSWNSNRVGDSLTLPVGAPMQFSAYVDQADYIGYEIMLETEPGHYECLESDCVPGIYAKFTFNADQLSAGNYRLRVYGTRNGWFSTVKEVRVHLQEDLAFAVSDGRILGYMGDETVTELVIPGAVDGRQITAIDEFAFCSCGQLTQVTLPAGLQILDSGAFMGCPLTSVLVPAGTDTQDWYFYEPDPASGQPRVYCVKLPAGVTKAEAPFLFSSMPSMTPDFVTPVGLKTIKSEAFANTAAGFVWLTDGVTAIGDGAFAGCGGLRFVCIPDSCQSIGTNAFDSDVILFVEWGSEAMDYAIENGYPYECYAEGFNG